MFKPGTYTNDVNVGFYTQVLGLGLSPDAVTINGAVHVEADWFPPQNATQNFWRGAENLSVNPTGGTDRWAVSARPRRTAACTSAATCSSTTAAGPAAAGSPTRRSTARSAPARSSSGSRATRSSAAGPARTGTWSSSGVQGAPANTFPSPPYTTVGQTPVVREKPFLYIDNAGNYQVFVPGVKTNAVGHELGERHRAGQLAADRPVLHRQAGRHRRGHERRAGRGQEPAGHAGCLPPQPGAARDPAGHRRARPRPRHARARTTASPR